jgi:hypothetical protein
MQNIGGNQTFHLQNLSAGSHKLTIYGNVSAGYFANQTELLSIVYFNVYYSSNCVTFILSLFIFVALASLVLFVSRQRLITRLKGEKNGYFWLGSVLAILASLLVVPLGWGMLNDYLFPYYNYLRIQVSPGPFVIGGLVALCVGIIFMGFGTMQQESGTRKQ